MEVVEKGVELDYRRKSWRRVHYEDIWSSYNACKEIIHNEWTRHGVWTDVNPVQLIKKSAKTSMAHLKIWSIEEFGEKKKKLEVLMNELQMIRQAKSLMNVEPR